MSAENLVYADPTTGLLPSPITPTDTGAYVKVLVDSVTNRLLVETKAESAAGTPVSLSGANKTVAAVGTPEPLVATSTLVSSVLIYPIRTNTGTVYVGITSADNTQNVTVPLGIEAPFGMKFNLQSIYVDVTVNGEGVTYIAFP